MSRTSAANSKYAFTLLELLLVTTLMAVLSAVALPRLSGSTRASRLESGAEAVAEYVRFGRKAAIERGLRVRLEFADEGRSFRLRVQDEESLIRETYTEFGDALLDADRRLPDRVRASKVALRGVPGPLTPLVFTPDGVSDDIVIVLRNEAGRTTSVVLEPGWDQVWIEAVTEGPEES
jgi:prepilin-type N-terminal cleavage/methylation domain-containing protein